MGDEGEKKVEDSLQGATIATILNNGLKDTFHYKPRAFRYTMPSDMRSTDKDSATRLDYIFCLEKTKVLDAGIIKNAWTEKASDHYPVYATIEI